MHIADVLLSSFLALFWENLLECGQLFSGGRLMAGGNCPRGNCPGGGQLTGRQSFRRAIIQVVIFLDVICPRTSKKKATH